MSHASVSNCLFCPQRPTIIATYMPMRAERMLYGKFSDQEIVQIDYGICEHHKYETRRTIRICLFRLAEEGKLELRR